MACMSTMLSTPAPVRLAAGSLRPSARRPRVAMAAGGSRQDQKAEYVKKQDEAEAVNPGGSAGGSQTRDKKKPTGAYGATGKDGSKTDDDGQIQKSDHMQDSVKH